MVCLSGPNVHEPTPHRPRNRPDLVPPPHRSLTGGVAGGTPPTMPRAIPFDAKYDLTHVKSIAISPTGDRITLVTKEYDSEAGEAHCFLFVAPGDGTAVPHRLTRIADAGSPRWGPDGAKLGFLATRPDGLSLSVASGRSEPARSGTAPDSFNAAANGKTATEDEKGNLPFF